MAGPDRIEGCAIVSQDGMIANAAGVQPDELKPEADQRLFYAALDRADAVAHGRHSSEDRGRGPRRRRLILTRQIADLQRDPHDDWSVFWNPSGASLAQAWNTLGLSGGRLVVIGGTDPFGLFLRMGYDSFDLTTASAVRLPGGRPVFPDVPARAPEELLRSAGQNPEPICVLAPNLTLVRWLR